jgi:hypothetical protein
MGKWNLSQAFASVGGGGGGYFSVHTAMVPTCRIPGGITTVNFLLFVALLVGEVYSEIVLEEKNISLVLRRYTHHGMDKVMNKQPLY